MTGSFHGNDTWSSGIKNGNENEGMTMSPTDELRPGYGNGIWLYNKKQTKNGTTLIIECLKMRERGEGWGILFNISKQMTILGKWHGCLLKYIY